MANEGGSPAGVDPGTDLRELLLEEGDDFIEAAYQALLNRGPDASGGPGYLRALRSGTPKLAILYELYSSDESRRSGSEIPGLLEAFAREGIGESPGVARAAAGIHSAEQLLVIDDPGQFVALAYRVLLKRPADLAGIASYKERLKEGIARTQVLHELYYSDERGRLGTQLPGLREAFRREGLMLMDDPAGAGASERPQPADSLAKLLDQQGAAFVECAHVTLLKRAPAEAVLYEQAARLRAGESKLQLLSELASLPGASETVRLVPELAPALSRHRLARMPLVGALVRLMTDVEGNSLSERRSRASEQRVFALQDALAEQVQRFEHAAAQTEKLGQQSLQAGMDLQARLDSLERGCVGLRKLVARYIAETPELDLPVAAGEPREPAARLALDVRTEEIFRDLRRVDSERR